MTDVDGAPRLTRARQAANLVNYTLLPRMEPAAEAQYSSLLDLYHSDLDFRDLVNEQFSGLQIRVISSSRYGIVLEPNPQSAFRFGLGDFRRRRQVPTVRERVLFGIALVGVATYLFPRKEYLREGDERSGDIRTVDPESVDRMLRSLCAEMRKNREADPAEGQELEHWRLWESCAEETKTQRGSYRQGTTRWYLEQAMEFLVERGLLRPSGHKYKLTPRFEIVLRDLAAERVLDELLAEERSDLGSAVEDQEAAE